MDKLSSIWAESLLIIRIRQFTLKATRFTWMVQGRDLGGLKIIKPNAIIRIVLRERVATKRADGAGFEDGRAEQTCDGVTVVGYCATPWPRT